MEFLLPIAAKSFVVAGVVLLLLKITQDRSASDRSWIAHLGLLAVLMLPVAGVALPALEVRGPAFLAPTTEVAAAAETVAAAPAADGKTADLDNAEAASTAGHFPAAAERRPSAAPVDWAVWAYALPAALLLLLTLIAVGRLLGLKGRANVMVEPNWLTALARAQRRMGFKHGTALLTSNELPSPISWGLMRPVILLNREAAESHSDAEAIIAHELAHVASLDWAKLLLSRLTVAMFWFNPLVWVLAREAHQLREEAADDAVLGADIEDTEYAKLLVGVARHECRGLLLGAHGVAPAKNSLSRRVKRVLDAALQRAPGGWRWSSAAAFFAAGMTVPVAAISFVPVAPEATVAAGQAHASGEALASAAAATPPTVATPAAAPSVASLAAVAQTSRNADPDEDLDIDVVTAADMGNDNDFEAQAKEVDVREPLHLTHLDRPVTAVKVRHSGTVIIRHGRVPQVRVVRGDSRNASVSFARGSLSASCGRGCSGMVIEVTTPHIEALAVSGGGTITVSAGFPTVDEVALAVHGGGTINARMLRARVVAAATSGGGTILAFADDTLAASTNGGGTIRHWGGADVASSIRGGGVIEPGGT